MYIMTNSIIRKIVKKLNQYVEDVKNMDMVNLNMINVIIWVDVDVDVDKLNLQTNACYRGQQAFV